MNSLAAQSAVLLLAFCIFADIGRELCFKMGVAQTAHGVMALWREIWSLPIVLLGFALWLIEIIGWILVLERLPLHVAFATMSLTYVGLPLLSHWLLKEPLSPRHWAGIGLVALGVACVGLGARG